MKKVILMRKVTKKDKKLVIELLTKSFEDNKSVNYIIIQDQKRIQRISALMDYSFEMCYRFGEVFLSEDNNGCALLLYPHKKRFSIFSIWLSIKLIFCAIGVSRIVKAMERESKIKRRQPKERMTYLWFIGVNPLYQHQQIGTTLLKQVLDHSKELGLPVYLETSVERNLLWYRRFGFEVYDELTFNYSLFFLKR